LDTAGDIALGKKKSYYRRWEPLALFHSHTDAVKFQETRELARKLGVSPQTLYTDIALYWNEGKLQENANRDFDMFLRDCWEKFRVVFSELEYKVRLNSTRNIETLRPIATVLRDGCLEFLRRVGWTEDRSPWTPIPRPGGFVYTVPVDNRSKALWCLLFLATKKLDDERIRRIRGSLEYERIKNLGPHVATARSTEEGKFETSVPPWFLSDIRDEARRRRRIETGASKSPGQFVDPGSLGVEIVALPHPASHVAMDNVDTYPVSRYLAALLACPYSMVAETVFAHDSTVDG
jgi:hypothetical protein